MFDLSQLSNFTDELSFDLISTAVLNTNLAEQVALRSGLSSGSVAINLLSGDANIGDRTCGWNPSGDIAFSQVTITIEDKELKMEVCPNDLRDFYLSQKMSPSANTEEVPFAQVIADFYIKKIKEFNENYIATAIKAQVTGANGANVVTGAAAFTLATAVDEAYAIYDAIGDEVKDRTDLIMIMSPSNYRLLQRGLINQNLYNFAPVTTDGKNDLYLPGTEIKIVKSSGLIGSAYVAAGPAEFIVVGTGLTGDESSFKMQYNPYADIVQISAYWRLGVAAHQVNVFATNGLA
jgi:hypothetical protein